MMPSRGDVIGGGAILLLALLLRVQGITAQPPLRDETLSLFTAESYVRRGELGPIMPFHPNLRSLILSASTGLAGTGAWGLRGPSLLGGVLCVPLLWLLVLRLTRSREAALLAALFLAVDPVQITFSRQAIQEVHTTFFVLLGVLLFAHALDEGHRLRPGAWLAAAGLAFGLASASKHHGLFPLAVCLALGLHGAVRQRDAALGLQVGAALALEPLTVYLLTYVPWLRRGYDLREWASMQLALLGEMIHHKGTAHSSPLDDRPWQWFLRPLMGYGNFTISDGRPFVTVAMGNPLVWMLVLPASLLLLRRKNRGPGIDLLQLLFWAAYLPLALSPRPIWLLSSLAVTPFAFALVAHAVTRVSIPRGWLLGYRAAVVAASLLLYPMSIGRGWQLGYLRPLVGRFSPHG